MIVDPCMCNSIYVFTHLVSDNWQSSVPSWEKEFCLLIGSVPWRKLLETKKCMYLYDNVVQWNDSAGEEAFCNAKKRYWAGINGLPCNISLPDPDIYIDKVDWNSSIDPELLLDLEQEQETPNEVDKDEKVVILGDSLLNKSFSCTGWGEDEEELQKAADLSRHPGNEDWDRKVDNDNNPWENSNDQNNGAMKDYGWGSHPNDSQAWNKWKNSCYEWENNYNGAENVDDRSGGNWGTYDDNSRKKQGSPRYMSRYKTSRFAGNDYQRGSNEWRNGRGRKKGNYSYVVDNKPASRQWNSCGYAIMDSGEQQFQ
ncbi:hypothetical protein CFP56_035908 [Quercus suber]|uniref:Uncharacterized protein n=1 Tax=Quercus suber TaxID=58331 RepID=A0AAW0J982_QUESU|nr:hypothetical protein CFP56_70728 [Quercus suber]POF23067.1 hypothetical protein CFP56_15548 [Quercus suber]